jgi:hypothetical protein
LPQVGEITRLNLQIYDGNPYKFVRAFVFDASGAPFYLYPYVNLTHVGNGLYINNQIPFPPGTPQLKISYTVFDDAQYTVVSRKYSDAIDVFDLTNPNTVTIVNQSNIVGTIMEGTLIGSITDPEIAIGELLDDPTVPG